ncbi:hypothetical protein DPEC_G00285160 [Dallia pectoralis]|uniref:Uncharacterized protein n=1 Tax=Dallia pectoralis TaxID=75939 RepID=A0ACC2FJR5_DALPE|nr:hypothetical protein DPEC_G00285160 [Dallia pectoralis]
MISMKPVIGHVAQVNQSLAERRGTARPKQLTCIAQHECHPRGYIRRLSIKKTYLVTKGLSVRLSSLQPVELHLEYAVMMLL